jgi:hypothetical protein
MDLPPDLLQRHCDEKEQETVVWSHLLNFWFIRFRLTVIGSFLVEIQLFKVLS